MENKVKILFLKILICVLLPTNLTGCWNAQELEGLKIVVGLGVDKSVVPEDILLTAQIVKPGEMAKSSQEGVISGSNQAFWNANSTGSSVFDAIRNITHKTGYKLYVAHDEVVVFGKDIASEGLPKYIDFFYRSQQIRPNTLILISRSTASEILDTKPETDKLPAMNLKNLVNAYGFTSQFTKVTLSDFANSLMSKTTCQIAPLVGISFDKGKKEVYISGMAVFKNGKMVDDLNRREVRGLLWVTGKIKSGTINVTTPDGLRKATLEIMKEKSKVTPELKDGRIYMHIEIKEDANLIEQSTTDNLITLTEFQAMEKSQADIIKQEIMAAFEKSKALSTDYFGFGDMVHKKYPTKWKQLEHEWDEIYPSIELSIKIETKIRGSGLITKPATPEKEEKQ